MEKLEFMSPAWIEMARGVITGVLAEEDLGGVHYTLCEEFTNPPEHLRRPGADSIGFYLRVTDQHVEVGDHPIEDADCRIVSEYEDALPVARDPNAPAADPKVLAERLAAGTMRIIGDPLDAPPVLRELNTHELLAPRTA